MEFWTDMADRFRAAGLNVEEWPRWKTRGWAFNPIGVMAHHTARPVPYPVSNLAGDDTGLIKCNVNIKPSGLVIPVAAGRANYSAGTGSKVVRDEVLSHIRPTGRAADRGLDDDGVGGSRYFFGIEVDHWGDGSRIPDVQLNALHVVSFVLLDMIGETNADRLITHAEWTPRKIDPYWNGIRNTGPEIRKHVDRLFQTGGPVPTTYIVAKGDTLGKIARRFNVTVGDILKVNPSIDDPNLIFPGQELVIPSGSVEQPAPPPPPQWPGIFFKLRTPYMRDSGAVNGHIGAIQNRLNQNYGAALQLDGIFGPKTELEVRGAQADERLAVDGVVGPKTWAAIFGG